MKVLNKSGFTFTELMVVVVILSILGMIGFTYLVGNISSTRDSVRLEDFAKISLHLGNYKENNGIYALGEEVFSLTNSGSTVSYQGDLSQASLLTSFEEIPTDPSTGDVYSYGVLKNRGEYQIAATLENRDTLKALVQGDYSSVSIDVLPSILLAIDGEEGVDVDIRLSENSSKFLFNNNSDNLPYSLDSSNTSVSSGLSLIELLEKVEPEEYWQKAEYKSCEEIEEAGKYMGYGEYQIIVNSVLTSTGCTL